MEYRLKGPTRLEILITEGFDGEKTSLNLLKIDKSEINQVIITVKCDIGGDEKNIKNFSIFFRSFFNDLPNLDYLEADTYKIGVYETFKDFFYLAENYENNQEIHCPNLSHLNMRTISQRNCPKDKGVKFFLEKLFGTGLFKHIPLITMITKNGLVCENFYSDKNSFETLAEVEENIKNIESIYRELLFNYYDIEN